MSREEKEKIKEEYKKMIKKEVEDFLRFPNADLGLLFQGRPGTYVFRSKDGLGAGKVRAVCPFPTDDFRFVGTKGKKIEIVEGVGSLAWMNRAKGVEIPLNSLIYGNIPAGTPEYRSLAARILAELSSAYEEAKKKK